MAIRSVRKGGRSCYCAARDGSPCALQQWRRSAGHTALQRRGPHLRRPLLKRPCRWIQTRPRRALDQVVVTGTPEAIRQFDAAFAVSILSQQQIELYAPLSSVDLFGKLPGFGAEPSGGEVGNNVNVRGLPSSNFRFVAVVEDGLPFFQEAQEPFLNADELVRLDLMTERVEAVRGGTSSIFASNAPGATINLLTRVGSDRPEGALRLTTGDFGLYRLDGMWSGPVGGDLLLAVGGYYRVDDGPRPTGFTADQGGQLRVNLRPSVR